MKNLGRIDLIKGELTLAELKKLIGKNKIVKVQFAMDLEDLIEAGGTGFNSATGLHSYSGVNDFLDEQMSSLCPELIGDLSEIVYEMTGFEKKKKTLKARVVITATASTAELFPEDLDDEDQEIRRRDEKNGLHGEYIDVSN